MVSNAVAIDHDQAQFVARTAQRMSAVINIERSAGASAIATQAIALAAAQDVAIVECVWDIGTDLTHEHAHRLDLITAEKSVRVYFPELELTTSGHAYRSKRITERLQRAIAQLLQRTPVATYSFR